MAEFTFDLAELGISPQLFSEDDLPNIATSFEQQEQRQSSAAAPSQAANNIVVSKAPVKNNNAGLKAPVFRLDSIDKITGLDNSWMEMNSDMSEFMNMDAIDEVKPEALSGLLDTVMEECGIKDRVDMLEQDRLMKGQTNLEQTQSLIDEVEEYLKLTDDQIKSEKLNQSFQNASENESSLDLEDKLTVDGHPTVVDESESDPTTVEGNPNFADVLAAPTVAETAHIQVQDQRSQAVAASQNTDAVLNALMNGQVGLKQETALTETDLSQAYSTKLVTETGENVIIIIAPSSPANSEASFSVPQMSPVPSVSPGPTSSVCMSDYDSSDYTETDQEWSPAPSKSRAKSRGPVAPMEKPRRKYQRKRPLQAPSAPYPCDKKERKKAQNRSAAFRYREKKKAEQDAVDTEVDQLEAKNVALKEKLTDLENEMKYLKKLMTEAGLGLYAKAAKI